MCVCVSNTALKCKSDSNKEKIHKHDYYVLQD